MLPFAVSRSRKVSSGESLSSDGNAASPTNTHNRIVIMYRMAQIKQVYNYSWSHC